VREVRADVVDGDTYREWLLERPVYFFGNGAEKCMQTIRESLPEEAAANARFIPGIEPLARWMQPLAERRLLNGETEDVAYFEPFYLKDYVAKLPKNPLI
jgi:tRNA threonylcarbamoyladenosine biosynthesis protein TsaB